NTYYTTVFAILLGMGYLVSSVFPSLESHMAQVFFGDLATLNNRDATAALLLSTVSLLYLIGKWKHLTNQSFEIAMFGHGYRGMETPALQIAFSLASLFTLCFSVQFVGFLFTISCLFLPTSAISSFRHRSLGLHLFLCPLIASISTILGFLLSLQ